MLLSYIIAPRKADSDLLSMFFFKDDSVSKDLHCLQFQFQYLFYDFMAHRQIFVLNDVIFHWGWWWFTIGYTVHYINTSNIYGYITIIYDNMVYRSSYELAMG